MVSAAENAKLFRRILTMTVKPAHTRGTVVAFVGLCSLQVKDLSDLDALLGRSAKLIRRLSFVRDIANQKEILAKCTFI